VLVLAAGDRHRHRAPHLGVSDRVLGRDRLLEPADIERAERAAERDRVGDAVRVVRIDQQPHAAALNRVGDRTHDRDVRVDPEADLDLKRREALRHALPRFGDEPRGRVALRQPIEAGRVGAHFTAERAAQQAMHRNAVCLAGKVPDRDVDRADRRDDRSLAAVIARRVVHPVPQDLGRERVLADQQRRERVLDDRGRDLRRLEALRERLAPADRAVVGFDLDDRRAAPRDDALRKRERTLERRDERMRSDAADLHPGKYLERRAAGRIVGPAHRAARIVTPGGRGDPCHR
jgi:hypothetical protein